MSDGMSDGMKNAIINFNKNEQKVIIDNDGLEVSKKELDDLTILITKERDDGYEAVINKLLNNAGALT